MMLQNIYQHYRREEYGWIDQVERWLQQVSNEGRVVVTPFLTPRQVFILEQLMGQWTDLHGRAYGVFTSAERLKYVIAPDYIELVDELFECVLVAIDYPEKFIDLRHSMILGALIHTGIDRNRIGDIVTDGKKWQCVIEEKIASYIIQEVQRIGHASVMLKEISHEERLTPLEEWRIVNVVISSMRLDTFLAKLYNISRQKAKEAILANLVQVNYVIVEHPDFEVSVNDLISMRRYGRSRIVSYDGLTKKDNIKVTVQQVTIK